MKMPVEAADGEVGVTGDITDGSCLVTLLAKAIERGGFQLVALREAAFLPRRGPEIFTREQMGAFDHG